MNCNLSTLMGKKRYTIQDVHEKTGLSRSTVSALYNDKATRVDYDTVEKLCSLFECSIQELFTIEGVLVNSMAETRPTLVSLFSGCGGMDIGFEQAGFHRIWANDFDADAQATFRLNLGEIDGRDIRTVPDDDNLRFILDIGLEKDEKYSQEMYLKEKITVKGVMDYHGGKDEWIIS